MPAVSRRIRPNLFLASLQEGDFDLLGPHIEDARLPLGHVLHERGAPIEHCYFMDGGMTSLLISLEDGASVETGVIGKEGFIGLAAVIGFENFSPYTSMVQLPGTGTRIEAGILRIAMLRNRNF